MEKIQSFQITGMTIAGFKSYQEPTSMAFGSPTVITGGNGRGKTSIADAIAFAVTGLPFFGLSRHSPCAHPYPAQEHHVHTL